MNMENNNENSFWKNNSRAVPGRPSPKKDFKNAMKGAGGKGQIGSTSFQDFQESVRDAWDTGDDEYCIISGISDTKISKKVSQSAALNVIKTHKSNFSHNNNNNNNNNNRDINLQRHNSINENNDIGTMTTPSTNLTLSDLTTAPELNHNDGDVDEHSNTVHIAVVEPQTSNNNNNNNTNIENKELDSPIMSSDARPKYRQYHAYPGRPQLLRFSSELSRDVENDSKIDKFKILLENPQLNSASLKELSWSGIPKKMRAITWRLLSDYLPISLERRDCVLERKRLDYHNLVTQYFKVDSHDESQQDTFRQIHIDVPRMNPHVQLFQQTLVQEMFERILFIWAIRHPASGYVQGINDLVTPFFIVFLQEALETRIDKELETFKMETLTEEQRNIIEADSFWCLSKFLDCIQDNYIFAQLGIQAKVNQLKEIIHRIDGTLHKQLQTHGVDYLQFSFRWMNNLLTRELPLHCTIRLWDTYLAESDGFAVFQLYVCAAFLLHWREQLLQEKDFQGLMLLLQNLPTHNWTDSHISMLVAEAYRLKFTYADAPKHLEAKS